MAESKFLRSLYDTSPLFVQNLMASVYGLQKNRHRYGHPKWKYWESFYRNAATWTEERLRDYQWTEVMATLHHAFDTCPFYRERFQQLNLTPQQIDSREALGRLPYTTKDDLRANSERIISEAFDRSTLNMDPTSGSTGQPLRLYNDPEANVRNYAIRWASCRPGLTRQMKWANFTGLEIVKPTRTQPPYWRSNYAARQRLYSVFHMNDETLDAYVRDLNRYRPDWMYGYPSAIWVLADYLRRSNKRLEFQPKAIITSSEQCLPHYREAIEAVMETTLWDEYGQAEFAGLAFQCECGKLHEKIEYSLMEFIPTGEEEDGFQVCELICTAIINRGWPLIRYQVGDTALIDPDAKCPLGKPGRIIERLHGRTSQFLETKDGRRISNISVIVKKCRNMRSCQAVQTTAGEMTLHIVRDEGFTASDAELAIKEFRKKIGGEEQMAIDVEYADEPLLTDAGKFLMIIARRDR